MTTYIYARTSTNEQDVEQQASFLSSKHQHDYIVEEQFTGTTVERPKFQELLAKLVSGDKLIVTEVSRIGRETSEVLEVTTALKKRGVHLVIDNLGIDITTAAGTMVLTMMAGYAKMERELLLERQRVGINRAKKEEKYKGRKELDPVVVKQAKELVSGGMTKAAVAKQMKIGVSTLYKYLAADK